jgi:hypothetical protein
VFFASVSYACFECFSYFVRIMQVFHMNISKVDLVLQLVFHMHVSCVLDVVLCVSAVFRRMLQVMHLVLHLCIRFFEASPSPWCLLFLPALAEHPPPPPPLLDVGVATYYSHLLQLLDACMCVRSGGARAGTPHVQSGMSGGAAPCRRAWDAGPWGEIECRRGRPGASTTA